MEIHGANWPVGAVIEMFGEEYRIKDNCGECGTVEYLDGTFATRDFYWTYQGERAVLLSLPEQQDEKHATTTKYIKNLDNFCPHCGEDMSLEQCRCSHG